MTARFSPRRDFVTNLLLRLKVKERRNRPAFGAVARNSMVTTFLTHSQTNDTVLSVIPISYTNSFCSRVLENTWILQLVLVRFGEVRLRLDSGT